MVVVSLPQKCAMPAQAPSPPPPIRLQVEMGSSPPPGGLRGSGGQALHADDVAAVEPAAAVAGTPCVFGVTLPASRLYQFLSLTAAVMFFFILYGYFQELIFRIEHLKEFGWYVTLVQFSFYTLFGMAERQTKQDKSRRVPLSHYVLLALLTVSTMGFSNSSLGYLNYPMQVIFKCCKLIPVLIGGILIQGKRYGMLDLCACICMSAGLVWFTLAGSQLSPNFNAKGIVFISLALCSDALIGNMQEKVMKKYGGSCSEMVLYSYSIGCLYLLLTTAVSGELLQAARFCFKNPESYAYIFIFSITGYVGVQVVLMLVKTVGALIAVTVTTCRKAITIILSFLFFAKPFSMQYIWAGMVIVIGIYLNIYSKNRHNMPDPTTLLIRACKPICQSLRSHSIPSSPRRAAAYMDV